MKSGILNHLTTVTVAIALIVLSQVGYQIELDCLNDPAHQPILRAPHR